MAFNGRFVFSLIHFAGKQGASTPDLIEITGKSEAELCEETCTLTAQEFNTVIKKALVKTNDPFLGLHFGESLNLASAGLVAQITQTCETIKQGLEYACEFAQLACSSLPMTLTEEKDWFKLSMVPDKLWYQGSEEAVRHTVDGTLVFTINEFHELTRKRYYPIKIKLPFVQPKSTSEYGRLLNCPIYFSQNEIAMFFEKEHINEKVLTSDYNLLRVLVAHAQERISKANQNTGFFEQVKSSVANLIKPEFPTIDQVANHLNISVRTLQRKLSNEHHTFTEIIESLRRDFAFSYLKNQELSINEIAYLLNYNDASAFIRSFKKWTGKTPNKFREV